MALDFSALEAEVTRDKDVNDSAALLLKRLFDEVEANKGNPAALQSIVDRVRGNSDGLSAAVTANTPAEPTPPPA